MKTKREIEILFKNKKFDFKRFNQVLKNYLRVEKHLKFKTFNKDFACYIYGWSCMASQRTVKSVMSDVIDNQ